MAKSNVAKSIATANRGKAHCDQAGRARRGRDRRVKAHRVNAHRGRARRGRARCCRNYRGRAHRGQVRCDRTQRGRILAAKSINAAKSIAAVSQAIQKPLKRDLPNQAEGRFVAWQILWLQGAGPKLPTTDFVCPSWQGVPAIRFV